MLDIDFLNLANPNEIIGFSDYMDLLYTLEDEMLKNITGSIVVGIANEMYGINFFQSVTGSFINVGTLAGVPLEEYWQEKRNIPYVFDLASLEAIDAAGMNFFWSDTTKFVDGTISPNKE